jgi:hypothetical protein
MLRAGITIFKGLAVTQFLAPPHFRITWMATDEAETFEVESKCRSQQNHMLQVLLSAEPAQTQDRIISSPQIVELNPD